ncbi:MAG: hypothetical protein KI786_15935, partial [Mameliella sp.]|nr:hypothetical protein [Phaeodactylibacter sp.]
LYFILAIGLFWGLLWIKDLIKDGFDFRNKALQVALLTAIGLKLALLAYLPVFDQVFNNPYVTYEPFKWDNLTYYGPVVLGDFVSKRWWLLPFVILGYALGRRHWQKASKAVLLLLTVLIVPFLLVYILGNTAPKRIFIPLIPVFSLLLATGICAEVRQLPWFKGQQLVALILIAGYGVFTVFQGWVDSREQLMSDIQLGGRSQGLTHQYFTWHYHPNREVDFYSKQHYDSKIPVGIVGCEPHGLPYFLEAAGIPFMPDANIDSLLQLHDTIDILTSRPLRILNDVSYAKGTIISKGQRHSYHTALRIWIDPEIRKTVSSLLQGCTGRLIAHGVPPGSLPHNQPALSVKSAPQALAPLQGFLQAKQPFAIIQPNGLNYKEWPGGIVLYHFALKNEKSGFQMLEAIPRPFERFKLSATNKLLTVSKDHAYANLWSAAIPDTALHPLPDVLSIDLKSQFAPGQGGTLVFDVNRNGNNIHWEGQSLNPYHQKDSLSQPASFYFDWPDGLKTGDQLKVYLWSDSGGHCTLNSAVVSRINFSD